MASDETLLADRGLAAGAVTHLRRSRRLSKRALSVLSGHSVGYVWKVESGTIEPSLRGFARLASALRMTPLELWVIVQAEAQAAREAAA